MAEVGHQYVIDEVQRNSTTATWADVNTATRMPLAGIDANSEYFVLINCACNGSGTAINDFEFRMDCQDVGGVMDFSNSRLEPRRSSNGNGHQYWYMERYTSDGTPDNIDMQWQSNGTQSVQKNVWQGWMIKLDDMTEDVNYFWDEDLTAHTSLDNTGWTDSASIVIGNGQDDYVIYYFAHVNEVKFDNAIHVRVDVDGTPLGQIIREGEDDVEAYCMGGMIVVEALAASSIVKVQLQTDSATAGLMDVDCVRIFAINLSHFEDHFTLIDSTGTTLTTLETDIVCATVTHTTATAATEDWAIQGFAINDVGESTKRTNPFLSDATLGTLAGINVDSMIQNGDGDETPLPVLAQENLANSTSLDIDFIVQAESDVTPNPVVTDVWMCGFNYELVHVPAVLPYFNKRNNSLLRM